MKETFESQGAIRAIRRSRQGIDDAIEFAETKVNEIDGGEISP